MCRILFLKGNDRKEAMKYIDGLFQAGSNDPFLKDMVDLLKIPKLQNTHHHGWGYLLVTKKSISTYLNGNAFFDDIQGFEKMKQELLSSRGEFILMAELRVTDIGMVSAFNSHPFYFMSKNGYEGYFFYNGLLDYEKLAELEGMDFLNFKNKNGTTIMGHTFAQHLEKGFSLKDSLLAPMKTLRSGYNLMAFINTNEGKYKAILNAYTDKNLMGNDIVSRYGSLIKREKKDLLFIGASSIGHYLSDIEFTTIKNGEYFEFDIDWIDEYYFDAYN